MTFLTGCQDLHRVLRIDDNSPGTAPTTVVGQTGVLGEIVEFYKDAYVDLQMMHDDWLFRRKQSSFPTVASTRAYSRATIQSTITDYDQWLPMVAGYSNKYVLCNLTSSGVGDQTYVNFVPYDQWRGYYDLGQRTPGKPQFFTMRPDRTLEFDPTPDAVYTITLDYRRTIHTLSASSDVLLIPDDFVDIVVWMGVMNYCNTRGSTEDLMAKATREYNRRIGRLQRDQRIQFRPSLNEFFGVI